MYLRVGNRSNTQAVFKAAGAELLRQSSGPPRVTVSNKSGLKREIAHIERPLTIGDFYDFGSILGHGGFGTVSEILHAKTFQPFAGKVIPKKTFTRNAGSEDLFRRVMEVFMNHEHAHIVRLLHVFEDESNYYEVMDVCHGGNIRSFVENAEGALPVQVVDTIFEQTAHALSFIHSLQMVHRDITPSNVMLRDSSDLRENLVGTGTIHVFLVDFDMCNFLDDNGEVTSLRLEGTPGYLAPEVLESRRYTVMSDIFAFGCVAYFVMLQEDPCPDLPDRAAGFELISAMDEWLDKVGRLCNATEKVEVGVEVGSQAIVVPVEETLHGFPVRLWRLLGWCLNKNAKGRPKSANEILQSGHLSCDRQARRLCKKSFTVPVGNMEMPSSQGRTSETSSRPPSRAPTKESSSRLPTKERPAASIADLLKLKAIPAHR